MMVFAWSALPAAIRGSSASTGGAVYTKVHTEPPASMEMANDSFQSA